MQLGQQEVKCHNHRQELIVQLNISRNVPLGERTLCKQCYQKNSENYWLITKVIEKAQQFYQNEEQSQDAKTILLILNGLIDELSQLRKTIESKIQQPNFLDFNLYEESFSCTQLQEMAVLVSDIEHNQIHNNIKVKKFRDDNQKIINDSVDYLNKLKEKLENQLLPFKQIESVIILQSQGSVLSEKQSPSKQTEEQKKQELKKQDSKINQITSRYMYVPISTVKFDEPCEINCIAYYDSFFSTRLICGQKKDDGLTKLSLSGGQLEKQQLNKNYHQVTTLQYSKKDNWFILAGVGYRDAQRPILEIHKDNDVTTISNAPKLFIQSIYLNLNEDQIICIGKNPNIHFWEKEKKNFNWNFRYKLEINSQNLTCLEVNEQQKIMLVGDNQGNMALCSTLDNQSWKLQQIIGKAHNGKINCIKVVKNDVVISADSIVKQWWIIDNSTLENAQNIEIFQNGLIKQLYYQIEDDLLFSLVENKEIVIHQIKYSGHRIEEFKNVGEIKGDYSTFCLIPKTKYLFCFNNVSKVLESLEQQKVKK